MADNYGDVYDPRMGWLRLEVYVEPENGVAMFMSNGHVSVKKDESQRVNEWISRLNESKVTALHALLVEDSKIGDLFHPCVYDDKDSPSAIGGQGCLCKQAFTDPLTALPVVREHYRTVSGNIETWTYRSITSRGLPPSSKVTSIIVDPHEFWMRDDDGALHFLPRTDNSGYGIGYGGGGPYTLCQMIEQLVESGGTVATPPRHRPAPNDALAAWARDDTISHQGEYTLKDLRAFIR
ncbi:hypothetical protein OHA91_39690 (plasmid) [Streptomyces erythrochromogenes]|uniref:Uncharacterized protein n=1 Tax=Streptomyces erythrochromogenes TaxID=285574 RepID=A0ABZ1QQ05_9ACTN|nr:hypothetical protein [Streptomyces erythrochromogenes]